jgi:DNA (cytosine-5)-methyltransferase 1
MQVRGGGQADDRYLWHEMLRVIDEVRPMWVIGENVNGITTMVESFEVAQMGSESSLFDEGDRVYRYRSEQTFTIERICSDLESKGYSVQPMLIPACSVAAPHRRDRIFILAYNVADSNNHSALRRSIGNESKGKQEWISKWNKIQWLGESANVRHKIEKLSPNTNGRKGGINWMHPGERWKGFPHVSAFYRGNDGIPFDVDNLTIPFTKWRSESLKAYGNAIVPQVMYQIMKVINDISTNN